MSRVNFTPSPDHFPFESRYFQSSVGRVHYIDEGKGRPILLLHGNPDWGFLYRKIVIALRDDFRCIVPDYPGFGLSDHPDGYGYTPREHAAVISELVEDLAPDDLTVMGQDWGGPIGMWVASEHHERISRLVMGNTWYWPTQGAMFWAFSKSMSRWPLRNLILNRNFFVETLMRRSLQVDISEAEFDHYRKTSPGPEFRLGIAEFPKQITASSAWLGDLEKRVHDRLTSKPILLVFGRKDPVLASDDVIARWRGDFPDHTYIDLPKAGHYIQEDAPDTIAQAIADHLSPAAGES